MASDMLTKFQVAEVLWRHGRGTPGIIGPIEEGITDALNALATPTPRAAREDVFIRRIVETAEDWEAYIDECISNGTMCDPEIWAPRAIKVMDAVRAYRAALAADAGEGQHGRD